MAHARVYQNGRGEICISSACSPSGAKLDNQSVLSVLLGASRLLRPRVPFDCCRGAAGPNRNLIANLCRATRRSSPAASVTYEILIANSPVPDATPIPRFRQVAA